MIFSWDPFYGWGTGRLPMPRREPGRGLPLHRRGMAADLHGHLWDLPWRALLASILLTSTVLLALLLFGPHLLPNIEREEPSPVKIAVRWQQETPMPIAPPGEPQLQWREELEPAPRPQPVLEPPPPPPPPEPVREAAPEPPPPAKPEPVPLKKEVVAVPPPPKAAPLPKKEVHLGLTEPKVAIPEPDLSRPAEREMRQELPSSSPTALKLESTFEPVVVDSSPLRGRYREPIRRTAPLPEAKSMLAKVQRGETELGPAPEKVSKPLQARSAAPPPAAAGTARLTVGQMSQDGALSLPAAAPRTEALRNQPATKVEVGAAYEFLDRIDPADLDRLHLVSLNRLRTCLDPMEEMELRGRLAAQLIRPQVCRTGGVVFDIRRPESAWSIHVDIYNYEKRQFQDRCTALRLAAESCERARR